MNSGQHSKHSNQQAGFYSQKDVDLAWDRFLTSGGTRQGLQVRDLIATSWERCLTQGVDPERKTAPILASEGDLHRLRAKNNDLMDCAGPVLKQAQVFLKDLEAVLFVTDYEGVNLEIVGDPKIIEEAGGIGLVPGCGWNEALSGSNAVGTAMTTRKPTQVHGEEHYCQGFKPWTCTASIISDPFDNQMLGVIDVSGLTNVFDTFHVPLVVAWASQIQAGLAKKLLEQWHIVQQNCTATAGKLDNTEKLLFDTHGRLISSSVNVRSALDALSISYDPSSKCRVSLERFGGDKIIYPHDDGQWISDQWLEPVAVNDDVVGFQVYLPSRTREARPARRKSEQPASTKPKENPFSSVYGISPSFKASSDKALKAAASPLPVLILGETGVGKEVFAQAIHKSSNYSSGPFVDLNCGAFTKDLLHSELFGHVEGAFTGAKKGGLIGKLEAAQGGTLFLDEIGEMPLEIQPIFLRVLQERKIYRIGDIKPTHVDFRLIAATNGDLKEEVAAGRFRKDLYFRLSAVAISLDPLAGRKEDIEGIAHLVLERTRNSHSIIPERFSSDLLSALKNQDWPGNIRELVNVVECMCFMSENEILVVDDLPDGYKPVIARVSQHTGGSDSGQQMPSLAQAQEQVIRAAVSESGGNITQAARSLGIAKGTLYQKMKKFGIEKPG